MKNEKPQLENGYIRIATEIWEAFGKYRLSGEEWLVLNCIIRKTYGYHKKSDNISYSQFSEYTGMNRPAVSRAVKKLLSKKIIGVIKNDNSNVNLYCLNKITKEWKPVIKKDNMLSKKIRGVIKNDNKSVIKKDTYNRYKDTYTKDIISNVNPLLAKFKSVNPSYERLFSNKTQRDSLERLVKKYGLEKMTNLLDQLPSIIQRPYAPSITTPYELELKMGKLILFLKQEQVKITKFSVTKV